MDPRPVNRPHHVACGQAPTETAFALAVRSRDTGDWEKSREWVKQCLQL